MTLITMMTDMYMYAVACVMYGVPASVGLASLLMPNPLFCRACFPPQAHPPTGVTHCDRAYFTRVPGQGRGKALFPPDLIVVKSTRLEIYHIR